jgi:hypothetical protein
MHGYLSVLVSGKREREQAPRTPNDPRISGMLSQTASLACLALLLGTTGPLHAELILPGTQPNENGIEFGRVAQCVLCHSGTTNGLADPYFSWSGGIMAQAARDPVFRAALAIANQDIKGVGEYCIRCHSPRGWLAGRSSAADASALNREDLHGVSCDACHHLVDPLSQEARNLAKQVPPGYGDAMYVADPENVARGPYGDCQGAMPHQTAKSAYHATSELCANCHNVSNPLQAQNVTNQPPHAFGHIERTYSEWALSDFARTGAVQTCQSCHYPRVPGGGQASRYGNRHRDYFVRHGPTGGSTWVQDAIFRIWKGKDLDREALDAGKQRAREFLKTAAALGLEYSGGKVHLTITNLTGHKLPTGYPEGRRMWVNLRFLDANSNLLVELGRYGVKEQTLAGQKVTAPTLLDPEKTRVYECLPGISKEQADKYKQSAGPSLHFILNDVITKDNRIPPRGFNRAAFAAHLSAPVGAEYTDGQYWDELEFPLPPGTAQVEVRLMYQSVSWEYLKFLVEEDKSDTWARQLYEAWGQTSQCPPEAIAVAVKKVE